MQPEPNQNQNNGSIRPLISMAATGFISSGLIYCNNHDYYGFLLVFSGIGLYLLKAYLYKKGVFD